VAGWEEGVPKETAASFKLRPGRTACRLATLPANRQLIEDESTAADMVEPKRGGFTGR
jgi:hypothetical protein